MMSSKTVVSAAFVSLGLLGAILIMSRSPLPKALIADTSLPVYDVAVADPAGRRVIDTINVGEAVAVTGCVDLKHYLVPEVLLRDGRKGYVIDGRFHFQNQNQSPASGLESCP
jgi:hypothetical protein